MSVAGAGIGCRLSVGRAGLLVGVPGPVGPRVALFANRSATEPRWALTLGEQDQRCEQPPAVVASRTGTVAAFIEAGVARRVRLPDGACELLGVGVSRVALAASDAGSVAVTAGASLTLHLPDEPGVQLLEQLESVSALEVAVIEGAVLVVYACASSATLGVCHWRSGVTRSVRHPLRAPCTELSLAAVGGRVGVALGYGDDGVDFAQLDAHGQMAERPHPRIRGRGRQLTSPGVAWVGSRFCVAALSDDELRIEAPGGDMRSRMARCPNPCRLDYRRSRLLVVGAVEAGERVAVRVLAQKISGEAREEHLHWLQPEGESTRRHRATLRERLLELLAHGRGLGRAGGDVELCGSGLGMALHPRAPCTQRVTLRFDGTERGSRLRVSGSEGEASLAPEGSLVRLAAWVRSTVGLAPAPGPAGLAELRERVAAVLGALSKGPIRHAVGAFEFTLSLEEPPSVEALLKLVAILREPAPTAPTEADR